MFFKSVVYIEDKHSAVYSAAVESVVLIIVWCLLEAFILEGLIDFVVGFFQGCERLFDTFYLNWIGNVFDFIGDALRKHLRYLGNGDLGDWIRRGTIMWFATGLPMFIWQMHRRENPPQ